MKTVYKVIITLITPAFLFACQTIPDSNSNIGYQIESKQNHQAILQYTMAAKLSTEKTTQRINQACNTVLQSKQTQFKILSEQIIANSATLQQHNDHVQIGNSRTNFSFSNTPNANSDTNAATLTALNEKPDLLKVIRIECQVK